MFRRLLMTTAIAVGALAIAASGAFAKNERFKKVLAAGKIVVGVKADYKPWGFREKDGSLKGMEIDMAKAVADALGVKLELIAVQSSNRMQFLQQGKIDLMIATMSDRADRRRLVGIVDPNYYTSGTNMLSKKGILKKWEDLRGKPVCGKQGAFYNKIVAKRYGAKIVAFVGNAEAKQAVRDGKCVGFVYDDSSIVKELASGDWDAYEMPLASEDDTPWGLAVPKDELDGIWGHFMAGMIYKWHASGQLVAWEKKWGIKPTTFLAAQQKKFSYGHGHLKK